MSNTNNIAQELKTTLNISVAVFADRTNADQWANTCDRKAIFATRGAFVVTTTGGEAKKMRGAGFKRIA